MIELTAFHGAKMGTGFAQHTARGQQCSPGSAWVRTVLLIELVLVVLDHVDEKCDGFLLCNGDGPEVPCQSISQLRLVEPRPHGDLVVPLVPSQRIDLKLEQIHLRNVHFLLVGTIVVFTVLALPLGAHALDDTFVVVADVQVPRPGIDVELQLALTYCLLDAFAVASIPGWPRAALRVVQETADLVVTALRFFFRTKSVHRAPLDAETEVVSVLSQRRKR